MKIAAHLNRILGLIPVIPETPKILDLRKPEEIIKPVPTALTETTIEKNLETTAQIIKIKHISD